MRTCLAVITCPLKCFFLLGRSAGPIMKPVAAAPAADALAPLPAGLPAGSGPLESASNGCSSGSRNHNHSDKCDISSRFDGNPSPSQHYARWLNITCRADNNCLEHVCDAVPFLILSRPIVLQCELKSRPLIRRMFSTRSHMPLAVSAFP